MIEGAGSTSGKKEHWREQGALEGEEYWRQEGVMEGGRST